MPESCDGVDTATIASTGINEQNVECAADLGYFDGNAPIAEENIELLKNAVPACINAGITTTTENTHVLNETNSFVVVDGDSCVTWGDGGYAAVNIYNDANNIDFPDSSANPYWCALDDDSGGGFRFCNSTNASLCQRTSKFGVDDWYCRD